MFEDAEGGPDDYAEEVLAVVERIPPGRVMSYGSIAAVVGGAGPRQVGRVLALEGGGVPWWRVVRADGSLVKGHRQKELLRAEGVRFKGDRVDMAECRASGSSATSP